MADPDIRARIGLRVKQLRAEERLTQGALSSRTGLNRSYLAEVETGKRNVSVVNIERMTQSIAGAEVSVMLGQDLATSTMNPGLRGYAVTFRLLHPLIASAHRWVGQIVE